jgi:hypothetical protein
MPPQIKSINPNANISWTHNESTNATKGNCAWVASTDLLFGKVADRWMQTMLADFGTDHWYQADGLFLGGNVPWMMAAAAAPTSSIVDPDTVAPDPDWSPVWAGAWGGMARTDPEARWLYQGWQIREWGDAAGAARLKALYDAVPHGQWVREKKQPLLSPFSSAWLLVTSRHSIPAELCMNYVVYNSEF